MNIFTIDELKQRKYPGSELKIEETIKEEETFTAYRASYISDGLKIYGYLAVPNPVIASNLPSLEDSHAPVNIGSRNDKSVFPLIVFCHGYIPPKEYLPERQYARFVDYFAQNGFVVFKPDYRGHGNSEGEAETLQESGYAIDVLNAVATLSMDSHFHPKGTSHFVTARGNDNDRQTKIGIWGHSMGGDIALKVMEVLGEQVKAGVLWATPFGSYAEMISRWNDPERLAKLSLEDRKRREEIYQRVTSLLGDPKENRENYDRISPKQYLQNIAAPIQIHHPKPDDRVPFTDSQLLSDMLQELGKEVELLLYEEGDHNFEGSVWEEAMRKSVEFFGKYI